MSAIIIDSAIDDLLEAAALENPTKREFEIGIARRALEGAIDQYVREQSSGGDWIFSDEDE